jgi:hypothetical protein
MSFTNYHSTRDIQYKSGVYINYLGNKSTTNELKPGDHIMSYPQF